MHDEIGSSIMHIALLGEEIQKREKDVKEIKKDVYTITSSAHKLVQTMSEIIWALNPQNETLEKLHIRRATPADGQIVHEFISALEERRLNWELFEANYARWRPWGSRR